MRVHELKSVSVKDKVYNIKNFKDVTKSFNNLKLSKSGLGGTLASEIFCNFTLIDTPISLKLAGERIFVLGESGAVYEITDKTIKFLFETTSKEMEVEKVNYDGEEMVFMTFPDKINYLVKKDGTATVCEFSVFTPVHATLGDKMFFAVDRRIVADTFYELKKNDKIEEVLTYVTIPEEAGKILALLGREKKMLIFCEWAVYEYAVFGDAIDYQLKKILNFSEKVVDGSVCKIGDEVFLVSGTSLKIFSSQSLKEVNTVTNFSDYNLCNKAARIDGAYAVVLKKNENYYLFVYDNAKEFEMLIDSNSSGEIADGGYQIHGLTIKKHVNTDDVSAGNATWQSIEFDFDSKKKKSLKEIYLTTEREITITVKGERGSENFYTLNFNMPLKTNLTSKKFTVTISGEVGIVLSDLAFRYRIKGE